MRKSVGSIFIKVLFGLLVASFAVWGIGDSYFFGQVSDTVAEVGDRQIKVQTLQRAFRNEMQRLRPLNIDETRARQLGVVDQVLNQLIATTLYDEAARDLDMLISESTLREQIRAQLGNITSYEFENILRSNGMSEQQFLAQLSDQLLREQYLDSLTTGSQVPDILVDTLYAWREEKRRADIIKVPVDPKSMVRPPTDAELETYYKAHESDFKAPEYRAVTYVYLDPKKAVEGISVSDQKLREVYDDRLASLSTPEKRTVLQMLLPDREAADKARDKVRAGEAFEKVAKELAGQDDSATRLGSVIKKDLPPELADIAFGLAKDKVSEPVEGPFGLQLIEVIDITPGKTPTLDEVRATLSKEVANEEAIELISNQANQLEEALGSGATLAAAAQDVGLTARDIAAIDRDSRDSADKPVPGLPGPPFIKTVFESLQGEDSLMVETGDGGFFVLRVESITAPALRPLASVRNEAIEAWKSDQRWSTARATAKNLVERLDGGAKIGDVAKKAGLKVTATQPFTRNGSGAPANLSPTIVSTMFAVASIGKTIMANGVNGVDIAQLVAIDAANANTDKKGVEALTESLRLGISNDIATQLSNALRERYSVTVNQPSVQYYFFQNAGES